MTSAMDPAYPAYSPRTPSSNIPYANINSSYPPNTRYDRSAASLESDDSGEPDKGGKEASTYGSQARFNVDVRQVNRTPSPTPSEAKELAKTSVVDWKAISKWRYWVRKEWAWYYVIFLVCLAGAILFTVYHDQIVKWLQRPANELHSLPYGWAIPIGILFVISFPPLFGHEIVAIVCGLVWGLWPGFGIVAAGTFLGELGNFYAFKYCCAARGEKLEKTRISYACLARVVREGGFKIALIARLSAIPGHFTTAVFSTCGMGVFTFSIAAILSLPKQFITVYLGVALEQSEDGKSSTSDTITKDAVLGVTTLVTIGAMWYIYHKMNQVKVQVIYDRRKARQAKMSSGMGMASTSTLPYGNPAILESTTSVATISNTDIPLTNHSQPNHPMYAPQPRRPQPPPSDMYPTSGGPYNGRALPPGAGYPYPGPSSQYPMQQVPPQGQNPFSDAARVPVQSGLGISYQRQAPPRGYGSPPPGTFAPRSAGPSRQPTQPQPQPQPQFSSSQTEPVRLASPPPPAVRPPMSASASTPAYPAPPAANPFHDPMPNPYERAAPEKHGMHEPEPSDATFYTAVGGHSRVGTEAENDESERPPSYSSEPSH